MLGDLIYEAVGKTTGMKVLDDNGTLELTMRKRARFLELMYKLFHMKSS